LVKPTKRHRRGAQKGKAKRQAGHPPRPTRLRREPDTDETDEEGKFTYEGTFTQKDDDL
jgi:hypothetical protein